MDIVTNAINTIAGYAAGLNAGCLSALARRVLLDLNSPELAERIRRIRNDYLATLPDDPAFSDAWALGAASGFKVFNRPMSAEQAYDVYCTLAANVARDLAGR